MALVVYWYDFVCFAIVGISIIAALWVIWRKECARECRTGTKYESLLPTRPEDGQSLASAQPGHVGTDMLWMSCWRGVHPGVLLVIRLVSGLVMAAFLAWDIDVWTADVYIYYTEWTFTLVIIYFAIGTIVSAYGCIIHSKRQGVENEEQAASVQHSVDGRSTDINFRSRANGDTVKLQSYYEQEQFLRRAGFWGYAMQIAYQASAGAVMLTDIVFWCLIVPFLSIQRFSLNLLMGCMHVLNAVFLLLDTSLNSLPFPWFRLSYFVLWSCTYVIFQWVLHACGYSTWPYPFLELSTPWAPLWYFALALVHLPCYGFYSLIVKAKNVVFSRLFPHAYIRTC
ncbi:uncharacterized protein LOC116261790 [Nymphaea colorata]|nr:uncharacterized protein LOC116261790 [Nymphaea colorata]